MSNYKTVTASSLAEAKQKLSQELGMPLLRGDYFLVSETPTFQGTRYYFEVKK